VQEINRSLLKSVFLLLYSFFLNLKNKFNGTNSIIIVKTNDKKLKKNKKLINKRYLFQIGFTKGHLKEVGQTLFLIIFVSVFTGKDDKPIIVTRNSS